MKQKLTSIAIAVGIVVLIGGCIRVDYSVFKHKYPAATVGDYVWSRLHK